MENSANTFHRDNMRLKSQWVERCDEGKDAFNRRKKLAAIFRREPIDFSKKRAKLFKSFNGTLMMTHDVGKKGAHKMVLISICDIISCSAAIGGAAAVTPSWSAPVDR